MSSERTPSTEPSLLARPLIWMTRRIVRFPTTVLVIGVALALVGVIFSVGNLGFKTSRLDLINPNSSFNRLWIEYIEEFGDSDDIVVVVEGEGREEVLPVLEELSERICRHDDLYQAVLHEVDLSKIRSKGLHYVPTEDLQAIEVFVEEASGVVHGEWSRLGIGNMLDGIRYRLQASGPNVSDPRSAAEHRRALGELGMLSQSLLDAFSPTATYQSPWSRMPGLVATVSELDTQYLLTNQGRMGFVLLRLAHRDTTQFTKGTESIEKLRQLIDQVQVMHPETTIGLTGLTVMENDEMRLSQQDMTKASLLSLIGVCCLFIAGLGGVRHPLMTVGTLMVAFGWTLGYITLGVGHLNILSISFGVILIGLGVDFGVHYVARYMQLRGTIRSPGEAIVRTAGSVGPGVLTGALTTAVAFFMAGFTDFTGIAELGVIAGGGVLLCCAAAILLLPAMIQLTDGQRPMRPIARPLDVHGWIRPLFRHPTFVISATVALTAILATGVPKLWYDHNLLNLQPEGLESVALERKLLNDCDQSVWYALSIAESREELLRRKKEFEKFDSLRVEEIVSLIPGDDQAKQPYIQNIAHGLRRLPERPPEIPLITPEQLGRSLAAVQQVLGPDMKSQQIGRRLEEIRRWLRRSPEADCFRRMSEYQHAVAGDLLSRLHILRDLADPDPPKLDDLPEPLVTRFVGKGGKYLMKIYSDADIWDIDAMEQFVKQVRSVDPRATGNPLQTYEASRQMQQGYQKAAVYALIAISILLMVDFRSLRLTVMAMVPMVIGMVQAFGIMGLLGIPLNPANMIIVPLILGIGIDDGVHVVHDFRNQRGRRYAMSSSTAGAILVTSLTTMIGFGSLMIASHQGLQSLGRVLVIGVSCCLFTSLVLLPAIFIWWTRNLCDNEVSEDNADEKGDHGDETIEESEGLASLSERFQERYIFSLPEEEEEYSGRGAA